ncbi:MAG: protein-export chaperone SecB [Bacilli bacterium]|jgi:hypothetical protein|nr:protein-export chaperone SecB [Bacilli bacterium]
MDENTSVLKLIRIFTPSIVFMMNGKVGVSSLTKDTSSAPKSWEFMHRIDKLNKDTALVAVRAAIGDKKKSPYYLDVIVSGIFECKNYEDDPVEKQVMEVNTISILFPYLRSIVTNITSSAQVEPFVLPIINTYEMSDTEDDGEDTPHDDDPTTDDINKAIRSINKANK